jgi:hypothetical protein
VGVTERIIRDAAEKGTTFNVEAKGLKKLFAYIEVELAAIINMATVIDDYNIIIDDSYNTTIVILSSTNKLEGEKQKQLIYE